MDGTEGTSPPIDPSWVVVVIDDDAMARELVVRYFEKLQLRNRVVEAVDGDEAARVLADPALHPMLVMLDLEMPGRSGLNLLRWMRSDGRLSKVPVVMLSGSAELVEVDQAYELGIASYLVKPVGYAALLDVLRSLGLPWALVPD